LGRLDIPTVLIGTPTGAREIKRIAERIATAFQSNIPREFPILLKLLDRISTTVENDNAIKTTKSYITETLCKIAPPTNGEEQTVAIRQLQASLHVLSNIKATLFEDDTEYNQTVDLVYDATTKFAHAEYLRLQKCHHSTPDTMTQYDQIIVFLKLLTSVFLKKKRPK
jgi:hypothetical protein